MLSNLIIDKRIYTIHVKESFLDVKLSWFVDCIFVMILRGDVVEISGWIDYRLFFTIFETLLLLCWCKSKSGLFNDQQVTWVLQPFEFWSSFQMQFDYQIHSGLGSKTGLKMHKIATSSSANFLALNTK